MPTFKLMPISARLEDEKWAASNLKEAVWVDARDELDARHKVESATLKMVDRKPGSKILYSPWLDDVVTTCWPDAETAMPDQGHILTSSGKQVRVPGAV